MKILFSILFIALTVSSKCFSQTLEKQDSVTVAKKANEEATTVYVDMGLSRTFNNQAGWCFTPFMMRACGNKFAFEMNAFSTSVLKRDNIRYVSSNSLPILVMLPFAAIDQIFNSDKKESFIPIIMMPILVPMAIPATAVILSNIKFGYPMNKNIIIMAGQKTDYFLFYHVSKVCTQSQLGLKLTFGRINADASINIPWSRGYSDNKSPFLSVGIYCNLFSTPIDSDSSYSKVRTD
jgi:hypothetical protein